LGLGLGSGSGLGLGLGLASPNPNPILTLTPTRTQVSACAQLAVQATQLDAGAKAEVAEAAEAMLQVPIARLLDVSSFVRCLVRVRVRVS